MELTFEQEDFISDIQHEESKLRELDSREEIIAFHSRDGEIKPVYDQQKLLEEVYADIPSREEEFDLDWLDDLYDESEEQNEVKRDSLHGRIIAL